MILVYALIVLVSAGGLLASHKNKSCRQNYGFILSVMLITGTIGFLQHDMLWPTFLSALLLSLLGLSGLDHSIYQFKRGIWVLTARTIVALGLFCLILKTTHNLTLATLTPALVLYVHFERIKSNYRKTKTRKAHFTFED